MALPDDSTPTAFSADDETALREILGYLNFSSGAADTRLQQNLNRLHAHLATGFPSPPLRRMLDDCLSRLEREVSAFKNSDQAKSAISLVFDRVLPAYRAYHADLLFHVPDDEFLQPFFVARVVEATLSQGGPWHEADRIVAGALAHLNDFLGHRPVAVLENGRQMQPYRHERFRPIPLYLRGAGAAAGRHHDLIEESLRILAEMPPDILSAAYFDLSLLDELALDLRAYDNGHPVYKRTNYTFGEWDPHCLDISGRYRRFVLRSVILDALHDWMREAVDVPSDERVSEAAAVLAGTMLMASSVSGSGPDTHDSNVSLTSLLPKIARQRDAFYTRLLQSLSGEHGDRLRREAQVVQQPFGRIRQHLNLYLAHYGCRQMQRAHLAWLYARMGHAEAARAQSATIPSAATRFETEIQLQLTLAQLGLDRGQPGTAAASCAEAADLIRKGIDCGALVDPWNILGFQGQFPLFSSREDSVADPRVDKLLVLMEGFFNVQSRLLCEAAAAGDRGLCFEAAARFKDLAHEWDRYATTTVADLPAVRGAESYESAVRVTEALLDWHASGEAAGDLSFWKRHVEEFRSPRSYAIVVDLLLRKGDLLAAINLLIQWLSESDSVPLEAGSYSFCSLLQAAVQHAIRQPLSANWALVHKFFDYIEANAGEWGTVPHVAGGPGGELRLAAGVAGLADEQPLADELDDPAGTIKDEDEDREDSVFGAAYENVVFRESALDGFSGDTLEEPAAHTETDLDQVVTPIEQRLRFLVTLSQAWHAAAEWALAAPAPATAPPEPSPEQHAVVRHWIERNNHLARDLGRLMDEFATWKPEEPEGDPDSLGEFDRQLHVKLSLLNSVISASVALADTSRALRCLLPAAKGEKPVRDDPATRAVLRAVAQRDIGAVRRDFPRMMTELKRQPLLYVPLDHDGNPRDVLAARNRQSLLRTLLSQLPELGLHRETWQLLRTAYLMERTSPPSGMSITEFDRLLESALQNSLECLVLAADRWQPRPASDARLVELFHEVLKHYLGLWLKHSATMRLSSAETLKEPGVWRRLKSFIRKYGGELFHPRMLTMGNLRGIVQRGADAYLAYLEEERDPLHPVRLLDDIDHAIDREEAAYLLETTLRCIVEKFDRFLEYNTTTTQSDYGEQLYCLLDFLRLETDYDRQAWNQVPFKLAHEVLSRLGRDRAAEMWRQNLSRKTKASARTFQQKLKKLERQHAMRLPSVTDRVSEMFDKPLALDRILSLVRPSMVDIRRGRASDAFARLQAETEAYLSTSSGSALEVQPWLQSLADEVQQVEADLSWHDPGNENEEPRAVQPIDDAEIRRQLAAWVKPLDRPGQGGSQGS